MTEELRTKISRRRNRLLYALLGLLLICGVFAWAVYVQARRHQRNYEMLQAFREVKNHLSKEEARPGTPRADALIRKITQLLDQGVDPNLRDEDPDLSGFWGTFLSRFLPPRPKKDAMSTDFALISMLPRHWHNATYEEPPDKQGYVSVAVGLVISQDDELVTILFRKLLDKGADVNTRDRAGGESLLAKTLGDGYWDCAEMLIKRGANVNIADEEGLTPLHEAARIGSPHFVKMLIDAGANIHARNKEGLTPLHYAVIYGSHATSLALTETVAHGHTTSISTLLNRGADIHAKDKSGKTALAYAKGNDDKEIIALLRKAGAK